MACRLLGDAMNAHKQEKATGKVEMKSWQGLVISILLLASLEGALFYFDEPTKAVKDGLHGGQVHVIQSYIFELLIRNGELQVWVTDRNGQHISSEDVSAKAIVISGPPVASPYVLNLSSGGGHNLVARDSRIRQDNDMRIMLNTYIRGEALFVKYWDVQTTGNVCIGI